MVLLQNIITIYPQVSYSSYIQVSISVDEFTRLEDEYREKYTAGIQPSTIVDSTVNDFERHCLDNKIDPYLQTK